MFANTIGSGFEDRIDLFLNNVCFPALERFRWEPDGQDRRPEPSLGSNAILSFLKRSFCLCGILYTPIHSSTMTKSFPS